MEIYVFALRGIEFPSTKLRFVETEIGYLIKIKTTFPIFCCISAMKTDKL